MLLLVNKTLDLLQDGVISRRFSHGHHLAPAPWGTSRCRCRDLDQSTADRWRETTARSVRRKPLLGQDLPALADDLPKRGLSQPSSRPRHIVCQSAARGFKPAFS